MNTSDSNVLTRYQAYRTRRFIENDAKTRHWLPKWRTQRRRRALALGLVTLFAISIVAAVAAQWSEAAVITWVATLLLFIPLWTMVQIVSNRGADAPVDVLDEWEIKRRNEARSVGLTITQALGIAAAFYLLFGSNIFDGSDFAFSGGALVFTFVMLGGCSPAMTLAWTTPDPDADDLTEIAS
ncbi:hypothetical protein C5142_09885 [Rhodococcus sp. BGS-1C]|uniref:hypothetical protein n=1 Tax=unclassified Rhodococcus (in: high G+C Gram-positive bacteria) TaxID=192944 RepID=UPI0019D190F3|nr:hypothetical protein [Rhodococcus sp. KRD197]